MTGWAEHKRNMKRFTSEKNGVMYVPKILKNRTTVKFSLGTGVGADTHDMTEEQSVDYSEPATSLTLSKNGRTAIRKLVKKMAPIYLIYNVDYRKLLQEHESGVGKDLTENVDCVLTDPTYNARAVRKNYQAEYDVFRLSDL